jgi:hypothetical protein
MWKVSQALVQYEVPLPTIHELVTHIEGQRAERLEEVIEAPSPPPLTPKLGWLVEYHVCPWRC